MVSWTGKLVRITAVHCEVDSSAVSAAIDEFSFFAIGAKPAHINAWKACRVHHRCRLLDVPESPCEHVGSIMHRAWDPSQAMAPGPMLDKVRLQEARVSCTGSPRDNLIVKVVADLLLKSGKKPFLIKGPRQLQQIVDLQAEQERSGREFSGMLGCSTLEEAMAIAVPAKFDLGGKLSARVFRDSRKDNRTSSLPSSLPSSIAAGVLAKLTPRASVDRLPRSVVPVSSSACSADPPSGGKSLVQALPVAATLGRQAARNVAPSTMRAGLADWLDSDEGRAWRAERDNLFTTVAGCIEVDSVGAEDIV